MATDLNLKCVHGQRVSVWDKGYGDDGMEPYPCPSGGAQIIETATTPRRDLVGIPHGHLSFPRRPRGRPGRNKETIWGLSFAGGHDETLDAEAITSLFRGHAMQDRQASGPQTRGPAGRETCGLLAGGLTFSEKGVAIPHFYFGRVLAMCGPCKTGCTAAGNLGVDPGRSSDFTRRDLAFRSEAEAR